MISIALPKGRLGERVLEMLEKAGYRCPEIHDPKRKLIFENKESGVSYFWVKPRMLLFMWNGARQISVLQGRYPAGIRAGRV